jgi:hypothetical protein
VITFNNTGYEPENRPEQNVPCVAKEVVIGNGRKEVNGTRIPLMRHVSWYLIFAMFLVGIAPRVDAGIAPSELIAMSQTDRNADMEKIRQVIEMKMVGERLGQFGLTQDEIRTRLSGLSDQQLHKLALKLDDLKVGGDGGSGIGIVIAVMLFLILLVILLQMTGPRGRRAYIR